MSKTTLKQLQQSLDLCKYYASIEVNQDLTGKMGYCENCLYNKYSKCQATQAEREAKWLCAKNQNKNEKLRRR